MFRFQHVDFLYALAIIPVIVLVFFLVVRWKKRVINTFAEISLFNTLAPNISSTKRGFKFIFFLIAVILLIVGLANPQIGSKLQEVKREGVDIMIALDVSNSMKAEDLSPNRLENAKLAISRLLDNLHDDRIGIIVFGGEAYVQLPVTTDYSAARLFLGSINTDVVPTQGTNISAAIELAMHSCDEKSEKNKALIIITDGENHEEDAVKIAKTANENGIVIHTIGMGSPNGAPIPVYNNGRLAGYRKDKDGNTVVTKLNEEMLKELATAGGGSYIRATHSSVGLKTIFDEINKMEKTLFGSKMYTEFEDRFQYFIGIALLLLIIEFFITERKSKWWQNIKLFEVKK